MTPSPGPTEAAGILPLWQGSLLPLLCLIWPVALGALAALPPLRRGMIRLLPLAPLPALALALLPPAQTRTAVPDLLLGVQLDADPIGLVLLAMTAALWFAAGLFATTYMNASRRPAIFGGAWCLTLTGNLGVFLAADAVTFYVAFAAVSLAAYVLVVHEGTRGALRAARVYITMAIIGEAMLLVAFVMIMAGAESTAIAEMRRALGSDDLAPGIRVTAIGLLIAGFGIKAGLMPLHLWLPLAHPAAPTPASAVLSGAIVKAGLIGLMRFLPLGDAGIGEFLLALGLAGAHVAAVLGLMQERTKAVLAYSTVSQMGLIIATIGAAVATARSEALQAAAYYAVHHGFAKGALFLSVALLPLTRRWARWLVLAFAAVLAASIAGLPGTGGALAKAAIKPAFDGGPAQAITASGVATTLVLTRFVFLAARTPAGDAGARVPLAMSLPLFATGAAALVLPWLLWAGHDPRPLGYVLAPDALRAGLWPVLAGLALAAVLGRFVMPRWPGYLRVPEGDLVVPAERLTGRAVAAVRQLRAVRPKRLAAWQATGVQRVAQALEALLLRWPVAGAGMLGLLILIAAGARG